MLKNITFSAEESDVARAREKAQAQRTTLNELFRQWIRGYAGGAGTPSKYEDLMRKFAHVSPGKKFSREELNER